ncbi:MAG: ribosome recycling factor [Clostridia bacterium]|nr:ribosome recycling factor [Clostridia bacterium]
MAYEIEELEILSEDLNDRTDKSLASFQHELTGMRVGRANSHILDGISVDYYGAPTQINQLANITIPEARLLCITVWDASMIKKVEKAIIDANIGITPSNDGKIIRLVFPEPNEERRRSLVKEVKTLSEKAKIAIRNIRRDIIEESKKLKKAGSLTEDMQATFEKDVDKQVTAQIAETDRIAAAKEAEIMKV